MARRRRNKNVRSDNTVRHESRRLHFDFHVRTPVKPTFRFQVQHRLVARRPRMVSLGKQLHADPRRQERQLKKSFLQKVLPKEVYHKVHDCKKEWSKLLSWRSAQGSGGRRRSRKELKNSKRSFDRKDC